MAIGTTAAILGSAVIGAGASALGASKNSKAINQATDAQLQATRESNALQSQIYDQNVDRSRPYVNAGTTATRVLDNLLYGNQTAELRASPGYQFRFNEGTNALNASFAARGLGNSGAAAKAAIQYGQNFGSNEYQNRFNQLLSQQNVGLSASNALSGVATNYAGQIGANNNAAASAIGNGALAGASNSNALFGNLAGIAGQTAGFLSSYGSGGIGANPYRTPGIQGASLGVIAGNPGIF